MATTTLTGTTGNDILNAPGSVTTLVAGLQGNDTITLVLAADEANAGQGDDSIIVSGSGLKSNTINAGEGNDTLTLATGIGTFNGIVSLDQGNDRLVTSATQIIGGTIAGNAGNDTISLLGGVLNAFVGGGQNSDSLTLAGGLVNATVEGGKGADTITLSGLISLSSINASDGHDVIFATGISTAASNVFVGAGKGFDSINLGSGLGGSVAGGGLNDTIRVLGELAGGVIYGDALGVTTLGTSTGSGADGNDLITLTAAGFGASTSIYGAGGNDTILLLSGVGATIIDGGAGNDLITNTGGSFSAITAGSILGGAGDDTISFGMISTGNLVQLFGGDGADSIAVTSGSGSINGGAGNDTISFRGAVAISGQLLENVSTLIGGEGSDLLAVGNSGVALSGVSLGVLLSATTTTALSGMIAVINYTSGDILTFNTTAMSSAANVVGTALTVKSIGVMSGASISASGDTTAIFSYVTGGAVVAGSVAVFDTNGLGTAGGDLILGVSSLSGAYFVRIVNGDSLITTTTGGVATLTAVNMTFAWQTTGALNITLG